MVLKYHVCSKAFKNFSKSIIIHLISKHFQLASYCFTIFMISFVPSFVSFFDFDQTTFLLPSLNVIHTSILPKPPSLFESQPASIFGTELSIFSIKLNATFPKSHPPQYKTSTLTKSSFMSTLNIRKYILNSYAYFKILSKSLSDNLSKF